MTNTNRATLVQLYKTSISACTKANRNRNKLALMSMTKNNMFAFETYGEQLAGYEADAKAASEEFAKAASGMPAGAIAAIIQEATA